MEVIQWKCRYINVDLIQVFVIIISNFEMKINAGVNVKNWLIKVVVIKDLFGILVILNVNVINHMMLERYLDYENCKCRKVEECTEKIDEK